MPPTPLPRSARARLRAIADLMIRVAERDPDLVPFALGVGGLEDADDGQLAIEVLGGDHPLDDLLGFTAPSDWWAFGLVAGGTARPVPGAAETGPLGEMGPIREPTRMRMVHLQPRRGPALSLMGPADGEALVEVPSDSYGRVPDACLRVLGRRTAAPTEGARELAEVVWLDRLLRLVIEEGCTRPDRTLVESLHPRSPTSRPAPCTDPLATGGLADLVRLGDAIGWPVRWRSWRTALAGHDGSVLGISPPVAEWMDDGMFARWIRGELPPMAAMVDDLGTLVPRAVVLELLEVLRAVNRSPGRRERARTDRRAPHRGGPDRMPGAPRQ